MKTTIDISDSIFNRSRKLARREHNTLRALVEEGLQMVLAKREGAGRPVVTPVTFKGEGLSDEFVAGNWGAVRDEIYRGHGA